MTPCGGMALAGCQMPTQPLSHSPSERLGRKWNEKVHGSGLREVDCLPVPIMGKTDSTWGKLT